MEITPQPTLNLVPTNYIQNNVDFGLTKINCNRSILMQYDTSDHKLWKKTCSKLIFK